MANKRQNQGVLVTLHDVRLFFAQNIVKKSRYTGPGADPNAKEKYQFEGAILKDSENYNKMVAAITAEAQAEWGAEWEETLRSLKQIGEVHCLKDGNRKKTDERPEYKDVFVVSGKNETRPTILCGGPDGRAEWKGDELPDAIYSGCYGNVILKVVAGSVPKKQVYAYFMGFQYSKEGPRLSGSVAKASDFAAIPSAAGAVGSPPPAGGAASLF